MKNILVLCASYQGDSIAKALREILDPDEFNVEVSTELLGTWLYHLHSSSSGSPFVWRLLWYVSNSKLGIGFLKGRIEKMSTPYIEELDKYIPDTVISLHPLMNFVASSIARRNGIKSAAFIIDMFSPTKLSVSGDINMIIAPFEETRQVIDKQFGISSEVATYPVKEEYLSSEGFDAGEIFESLNLTKQYTILFSSGRFSRVSKSKVIKLIKNLPTGTNLIVLCGKDIKRKKQLEMDKNIKSNGNVKIIGEMDDPSKVFLIADIHFTTSGTTSFIQSLAAQTPIYIYSKVNERFTKMAKVISENNLGRVASFNQLLLTLRLPDAQLNNIRNSQIEYLKNHHVFTQKVIFTNLLKKLTS